MGSPYWASANVDPLALLLMQEGEIDEAEALIEFHEAGLHLTRGENNEHFVDTSSEFIARLSE